MDTMNKNVWGGLVQQQPSDEPPVGNPLTPRGGGPQTNVFDPDILPPMPDTMFSTPARPQHAAASSSSAAAAPGQTLLTSFAKPRDVSKETPKSSAKEAPKEPTQPKTHKESNSSKRHPLVDDEAESSDEEEESGDEEETEEEGSGDEEGEEEEDDEEEGGEDGDGSDSDVVVVNAKARKPDKEPPVATKSKDSAKAKAKDAPKKGDKKASKPPGSPKKKGTAATSDAVKMKRAAAAYLNLSYTVYQQKMKDGEDGLYPFHYKKAFNYSDDLSKVVSVKKTDGEPANRNKFPVIQVSNGTDVRPKTTVPRKKKKKDEDDDDEAMESLGSESEGEAAEPEDEDPTTRRVNELNDLIDKAKKDYKHNVDKYNTNPEARYKERAREAKGRRERAERELATLLEAELPAHKPSGKPAKTKSSRLPDSDEEEEEEQKEDPEVARAEKAAQEAAAALQRTRDAAAKKNAEEAAARKKAAEEAIAKKKADEEAAKKKAEDDAAKQKAARNKENTPKRAVPDTAGDLDANTPAAKRMRRAERTSYAQFWEVFRKATDGDAEAMGLLQQGFMHLPVDD